MATRDNQETYPKALSPEEFPAQKNVRRWKRHDIAIQVNVTLLLDGMRSSFRGEACDISRGGMRLFVTRELEPGASVVLEFLIPYNTTELVIRGVIRNRSGFTHGVEFINPTAYQQQIIDRACKVIELLR